MGDVLPKASGAQADLGKSARGGGDHGELRRGNSGEQVLGARKGDDVGDIFNFGALHPAVFGEMDGGIGVGEKLPDGGKTGAAVGKLNDVFGVQVMLEGPAGPDADNGGSGIDEHAIDIEE